MPRLMRCETICGVHKALKLFLINLPFLILHSLTKLLPCRSLDMFHKESKCSKQSGPSINLKFRSKTLQLEKQRECHVLLVPFIFCINEHQSGGARLFITQQMGAKREKGARGRHATQAISFPSTELQLREAADNFKNQKRKEKKQQQQQSTTSLHNRRQKGQRIGKKGRREGDWVERAFLPPLPLPFLRLSRLAQELLLTLATKHLREFFEIFIFFKENL